MEQKRICKRCLLKDLGEDKFYKDLQEYLDNMDPEIKADAALYEQRLSVCRECDYLNAGMCRACGCYVEMRAANINGKCPYDKW